MQSSTSGATSVHDTSLEELKKLNPTSSPLDSMDELHKALDSMHSGAVSSRSQTVLTVRPTARARFVLTNSLFFFYCALVLNSPSPPPPPPVAKLLNVGF